MSFDGPNHDDVGVFGSDGTRGFGLFACLVESVRCAEATIPSIIAVDRLGLRYAVYGAFSRGDINAVVTLVSGPGRSAPPAPVPAPTAFARFGFAALGLGLRRL